MKQLINYNNKLFWMFERQLVLLAIDLNFEKYMIYFLLPSHFSKRYDKLRNVSQEGLFWRPVLKLTCVLSQLTFKMQEETKNIWAQGSLTKRSPKQIIEAINRFLQSKGSAAPLTLTHPKGWKYTYSYTMAGNPSVRKCVFPEVCSVRISLHTAMCHRMCLHTAISMWSGPITVEIRGV